MCRKLFLSRDHRQEVAGGEHPRGDFDPLQLAQAPRALADFVELVPLDAPDGEPLVLELSQFLGAIAGRNAVAVTGEEGREALDAALRIVSAIEQARALITSPSRIGA